MMLDENTRIEYKVYHPVSVAGDEVATLVGFAVNVAIARDELSVFTVEGEHVPYYHDAIRECMRDGRITQAPLVLGNVFLVVDLASWRTIKMEYALECNRRATREYKMAHWLEQNAG